MSIYVLSLESHQVMKIYAEHTSNIIGLSWSKTDPSKFASAQPDALYIWDLNLDSSLCIAQVSPAILSFEFDPFNSNQVVLLLENGDMRLFDINLRALSRYNNFSAGKPNLLRMHPNVASKFALSCADGFLLVGSLEQRLVDRVEAENWKQGVEDLAWDPLSENYLLVAFREGTMMLFDTSSKMRLRLYERQSTGIKRVIWNKKRLGEFFTCDGKVANLKVWHVSKAAPGNLVKLGISGVKDMFLLDDSQKMLCTYRDGAVSVFNLAQHRMEHSSEPGHTETIFDISVKPDDPNKLATCSYDGTIKIWDVLTMKNIETLVSDAIEMGIYKRGMEIRRAVFYGLAWGTENYIAGSTSLGEVLLYDFKKLKLIHRTKVGPEAPIYRITWHPRENVIAVPTLNCNVCILTLTSVAGPRGSAIVRLNVTRTIQLGRTDAYGVAFSPLEPRYLAIGCKNNMVLAIDTSLEINQLMTLPIDNSFRGHSARVFNVAWSPLNRNWLASTSDDNTVIVWDFAGRKPLQILEGHTSNVRPAVWSSEIEHLLLSGSWDGTIRMWDVRSGICIYVAAEHHADVYGLCSHPSRPFLFFSCSRDTSIRLWTIEDYIKLQVIKAAAGLGDTRGDFYKLVGRDQDLKAVKFNGAVSANLIERLPQCSELERWSQISTFLLFRAGERDFFDVLKHLASKNTRATTSNLVLPFDELFEAKRTEAEDLVMSTSMHWLGGALAKKEDRLNKAANMYLRLGEFKSYCDIQVELGHFEKAMALAPRVSLEYWEEVGAKYALHLQLRNYEEATNYFLAVGNTDSAIKFMTQRGDFKEALFIAHNQSEDKYARTKYVEAGKEAKENSTVQLKSMAALSADEYFNRGESILAATQHIVADDIDLAIDKLIRSDELLYALILAKAKDRTAQISRIKGKLSKKAEKMEEYELAINLLDDSEKQLGLVRMYGAKLAVKSPQYKHDNDDSVRSSVDLHKSQGNFAEALKSCLILNRSAEAFQIVLENSSSLFETPAGLLMMFQVVDVLKSINPQEYSVDQKCELMALTSLIGGIHACHLGYSVAKALLGTCRNFVNWRVNLLAGTLITKLEVLISNCGGSPLLPAVQEARSLLGGAEFSLEPRDIKLIGSNLPSNSMYQSAFTGKPISGHVFKEETLIISQAEAMMWADVNPFSPLNNGALFNPY